jgi:hypothetical protein
MRRCRFCPVAVFLASLVLGCAPLAAQLTWETTHISHELELAQNESDATFRFENTGKYPVTVRSTASSCGCTTARFDRKVYQPGDKGEITTRFVVGERTGVRRNTVQVLTDDPSTPNVALIYEVEIPSLITVTPRILQWRVGSAAEEKTINVKLNAKAGFKITGVNGGSENFRAVIREGERPGEYLLAITPVSTASSGKADFSLLTDSQADKKPAISIHAFVL